MKITEALVTGATSGIGRAIAEKLASEGIPLLLTGRRKEVLENLLHLLKQKVSVEIFPVDLSIPKERKDLVDLLQKKIPNLIINCAGVGRYGPAIAGSQEEQLNILRVNGEAVIDLSLEAAKALKNAGKEGIILNVASAAGFFPFPDFSVYSATKALIQHFSEAFDVEMSPFGIRVLCANPGMVKTEFQDRAGSRKSLEERDPLVMSAEFAAEEIWNQIQQERGVHTFHWFYRLFGWLAPYLPRRWVMRRLQASIQKRHTNQSGSGGSY